MEQEMKSCIRLFSSSRQIFTVHHISKGHAVTQWLVLLPQREKITCLNPSRKSVFVCVCLECVV